MSWVHKIRLHGRGRKRTAEPFSRLKIKAGTAEGRWKKNSCVAEKCSLTSRINGMTKKSERERFLTFSVFDLETEKTILC